MKIALAGPFAVLPFVGTDVDVPAGYRDAIAWTPVCDLAVALSRVGHHVHVFTLNASVAEPFTISSCERIRITVAPMRPRARHRMRDLNAGEVRVLQEMLDSESVDLVHAHWSYEYALAAGACGYPAVVTVHDCPHVILMHSRSLYRLLRMFVGIRGMRVSARLTTVSPYMLPCVKRVSGVVPDVIPNMIDDCDVGEGRVLQTKRRVRLLSVANGFYGPKNIPALLRATALLRSRRDGVTLALVGHDHQRGGLAHRWAIEHGLSAGVDFVGPISRTEVYDQMERSTVLVHSSLEESFGMVLVEAMARGLPVLGHKSAGAVPWVVGGVGGLVDMRDPSVIANEVTAVVAHDETYGARSLAGIEEVRRRFTYSAVLPQYLRVYAETAGL